MKHPDRVQADNWRAERDRTMRLATEYAQQAIDKSGVAPELAAAYDEATAAMRKLAAAQNARADYFDESAKACGG